MRAWDGYLILHLLRQQNSLNGVVVGLAHIFPQDIVLGSHRFAYGSFSGSRIKGTLILHTNQVAGNVVQSLPPA